MSSRMEKYSEESPKYSRTMKNANLYKEVYGNYEELDYFPIADNTNEIDMSKLKELVRESTQREIIKSSDLEQQVEEERNKEEQRVYDINKILERVREKNTDKDKERDTNLNYNYLKTLESEKHEERKPISKEKEEPEVKEVLKDEDKLYETRELKFLNKQKEVIKEIIEEYEPEDKKEEINKEKLENKEISPLDLLEDLKPDENSFIVEPANSVKEDSLDDVEEIVTDKEAAEIITDEDNSDIDVLTQHTKEILKQTNKLKLKDSDNEIDNDFYTSSYKFSKKDFISDDEDDDAPRKSGGVIKIILLVIAIFALIVLIYYFIHKYGIGA